MAFLGKGKKQDMLQLAEELGINATLNMTVPSIKIAITNSEGYEEEFVKNLYETIIANGRRLEELERAEKMRLEELERAEKMRLEELERAEKMRLEELVKEQALKEKELQLKFDLERFQIESGFRENDESNDSTNACSVTSKLNLKKFIPDFDPKQSDISLYLVIFERQAKRASIEKKEFKLSPEVFRQKFVQHQKKSDSTWKDFTFEITNYLDEWLIGLEINTFQDLKDLMVVDQLKKRANTSMKDHFLDNWANLKSATQIAELFDNYEDVRKVNSKPMDRLGASVPESTRERTFEKRVIQRCYHCYMPGHIKAGCPKLIKNKTTETLNNIEGNENPDFLNSYTTKGSVNGHEIDILRDTGATIDLVCAKYINPSSFSGENVWVKQPLSPELVCLPLAVVVISGNFGTVQTKAAVCGNHLNQHGRYLLGNKTAELIKGNLGYNFLPVEILNAVQTRSQVKAAREERGIDSGDAKKGDDEVIIVSSDAEDEILIPALQEYVPELALLRVTRENLINAQKNSEKIKSLYEQEVFTKLNIDACGPLPITSKGNRYLITAICMSSKFPEAIPVSDISSVSVTDALLNIFSRMGFPREIQCDQGTSFISALTTEFFERFGILVRHSSVYHPQSNPVERFHRTLKRLLSWGVTGKLGYLLTLRPISNIVYDSLLWKVEGTME
ncbi:retrovirus-related Pol polyprotein from transposon 412 [Trichonephila clavipes]|uniref:Retrovirus-related Pol polyprotein from transposon 412 n=1 Tax=Trichonephila clavipes TaxID=2585209 RepID=A0A8X6W9J0_TRICX|nr:retrovirus-related Pol polyprotein from transposon 412 [Trichonephila clavipes]